MSEHNEPGWQVKEFEDFDYLDDDLESYLTNSSRCSECGYYFDESELETLGFVVEESGVCAYRPQALSQDLCAGVMRGGRQTDA